MFKSVKSPNLGAAKPDLWADGAQFVPLTMNMLTRASSIIARKSASKIWLSSSTKLSDGALALEDGFGAPLVRRLGGLALVLPSRRFLVHVMTGVSRLQASAAQHVDYHSEPIAPLEISDLHGFLQTRRAEAIAAENERARKDALGQIARRRAIAISRRPKAAGEESLQEISDSSLRFGGATDAPADPARPSPSDPAEARASIGMEELLAIRMALASIPEAPQAVLVEDPPIPPKELARLFATSQTPTESKSDADEVREPQSNPSKPAGLLKSIGRMIGAMFRGLGRLVMKALNRTFSLIWRLIGPTLAALTAYALGWGMVVLCWPFGLGKAIWSHTQGMDLRDYE
jgi:hypothetical protein